MMSYGLGILIVAAHLLAMNLATAGPLLCLGLQIAERRGDRTAGHIGRRLARWSNVALVQGIVLGLFALLLAWWYRSASLEAAAKMIPYSRFTFGVAELLFYLICQGAYAGLWRDDLSQASSRRFWGTWCLALLAGSNLAYHFPPLFSMLGSFSTRSAQWGQTVRFTEALFDPEVAALSLHFLIASLAVGGVVIAWTACHKLPLDDPGAARWQQRGGWLALGATGVQLLSGVWLLAVLDAPLRDAVLGEMPGATFAFLISLVAVFGLIHQLANIALSVAAPREIHRAIAYLAAVVVLMVAALHEMRRPYYATVSSAPSKTTTSDRAP